ncbi:MAG: radical SAM protein [Lachnospiraceae bacterium]|nr:radical SAM protein [Lachnospiraceae bacterium]
MITLLPEKKGTFLRASLCDVCNFSCEYCAKDMGMENHTPKCIEAGLLSAEEYGRNLERIAARGFEIISFTGGEPLLCKDFALIAQTARQLFKVVEITTNGSKLPEHMETIRKYVDVLKISVDAVDDDLRVKITRRPEARDTLHIVEACCKAGIAQIGLNFVYMKQNEDELPKLIEFVKRLNKEYNGNIYISVLDLYYSKENDTFWREQFVNLKKLRQSLAKRGIAVHRRLRVGCDSYYCIWDGVRVNMKDSMSCTHRSEICSDCMGYCQEGIYSLKHSASGWLSVCPSNDAKLGALLRDDDAESTIDRFVEILNNITRVPDTGSVFMEKNGLCNMPHMKKPRVKECLVLRNEIKKRARQYCEEHGFLEFDTPVLTKYAGEPYNPTFPVLLEEETVRLVDSPQVYKMLLMLSGYDRYYQFAHCFRPIVHEDAPETHLREFMQLDIEMKVDSLDELMDSARELLQHVCKDAAVELVPYLPLTTGKKGVNGKIMPEHHIFAKPADLRTGRERTISEPEDLLTVKTESFDILLNGIEVGGGDMRIMDVSMQESMMELFGVEKEVYRGYLQELGRYQGRPFGGFAIGLERLIMAMTGVSDIRETIAFDTWQ